MFNSGLFDPVLVPNALFDEGLEAYGLFDRWLIVLGSESTRTVRLFKRTNLTTRFAPALSRRPAGALDCDSSPGLDRVVPRPLDCKPGFY